MPCVGSGPAASLEQQLGLECSGSAGAERARTAQVVPRDEYMGCISGTISGKICPMKHSTKLSVQYSASSRPRECSSPGCLVW